MLPKGVFRLDTATPAKPDDGATYAGSILHVSAKGVYQVHGNGVARHDPANFQQVPKIGDAPKIVYANGRDDPWPRSAAPHASHEEEPVTHQARLAANVRGEA